MKIAYADPPYPGQSKKHYRHHPDYDGEVDHAELARSLQHDYDGFILHTSSPALGAILPLFSDVRVGVWVKPFAAFKRNVPCAYAWEPIIFRPARKQTVHRTMKPLRDWVSSSITLKKGLTGVKPESVCWACFEWVGAEPTDFLSDLFPGTGAVTGAWHKWCKQ